MINGNKILSKKKIISIFIIFFLYGCPFVLDAQNNEYNIQYYTTKNGLSHSQVTDILCDKSGFMWFSTWGGGLNKFDGYNFTQFKPKEDDLNCISSPSIECIFEDSKGYIWIGTKNAGLDRYDPETEKFIHFELSGNNDLSGISDKRIRSFFEDKDKNLWIGTWNGGVNRYNYETNTFKRYLGTMRINDMVQTRDSTIWVVAITGIYNYFPEEDTFRFNSTIGLDNEFLTIIEDTKLPVIYFGGWGNNFYSYNYQNNTIKRYSLNHVYSMDFTKDGDLFVGTWSKGLYKLTHKSDKLIKIKLIDERDLRSRYYRIILDIYIDKENNIWLGLENGGICKLSKQLSFNRITYVDENVIDNKLVNISQIIEDKFKNIWIGSYSTGLFCYSVNKSVQKIDIPCYYSSVQAFYKHDNGKIWIGIDNCLCELDWINNKPVINKLQDIYNTSPGFRLPRKPTTILESDSVYWIGSQQSGLYLIKRVNNKELRFIKNFLPDVHNKKSLKNERISYLFQDNDHNIWIGTYGGLHLFKRSDSSFVHIEELTENNKKFTCNIIYYINQDSDRNLWIGTPCGLHKLTKTIKNKYKLKIYTTKNGLPDDIINSIIIDKAHKLWVSHNVGISMFDPKIEVFRNYYESDGILPGFYNIRAGYKNSQGFIFFGGEIGLTYFNPENITDDNAIPKIAFTSMNIWNHPVLVGQKINNRVILPKSLNYLEEITITHKEAEFSFEIVSLDYTAPEKNQYAYMLVGRDNQWNKIGTRRWISFSNLKSGEYILKIKGSNNNNVWNQEGRNLIINVLPPWWERLWFRIFILLIIIGSVILFYFVRTNQIRLQKKELEKQVDIRTIELKQANQLLNETNALLEERQQHIAEQSEELKANAEELGEKNKKLNELVATKDKFLSIIAHDLKNPFNLILGFVELLRKNYFKYNDEKRFHFIESIHKSTNKIFALLENLLQWARSQMESIKFDPKEFNIYDIVKTNVELVGNMIKKKALNVEIKITNPTVIYADENMINAVIRNLLINAIKFTDQGKIIIETKITEGFLIVNVKDTGQGMTKDMLRKIFDICSNRSTEGTRGETGSGLGLLICKEFIERHGGEINVESQEGKGTNFCFCLPVKK